jgi:hypothetical protein
MEYLKVIRWFLYSSSANGLSSSRVATSLYVSRVVQKPSFEKGFNPMRTLVIYKILHIAVEGYRGMAAGAVDG